MTPLSLACNSPSHYLPSRWPRAQHRRTGWRVRNTQVVRKIELRPNTYRSPNQRMRQVTIFGAFFDSVIDRYSDVALFFGLLVYYARANRFFYVVLVAIVMVSSVMVSYTRARAESLIPQCKAGFMERPERIVLVILGA